MPCLYYFKTEEEWRRVVPSYVFESGQHGHEITRDRYAERFLSSSTAELPSSAIILWQRLRSPTSSVFVLPYNLSTGNSERVEFFESVEEERGVLIIERTWTPEHGTGHYELVRRLRGGKRSFFSPDDEVVRSLRNTKMLRLYKLFTRPVPDTSKNKHVFREIVYHTTDESDEWIVVKWLGGEHTIELLDFFAEELNDQELLQTLLSMAVNDNDNEARIEAKALLRRRHWETYPNAETQQQARRSTRNHSSSRAEPFSGVSRVKRQRTTPTSILPHRIHVSSIPALFRCSRCTLKSPGPQPIAGIFVCSHCLRDNCGETVYIKRYGRPRLTPVRVVVRSSDDAFVREAELLARNDSVTSGSFNKADIIVVEYHHDGKTAEQHIQFINEAIRQSTRKEPDIVLVLSCWENNVEQNRAMQTLASQHRSTIFVTFHESVPPRECFSQSHEFLSDTIAYSNVRFLSFFVALCERRHKCVLYVDLNHPSGPGPFRVIKRVSGKSNVCVLCGKTYPKMGGSLGGRKWVSGTGLRMLRCPVCCVDALVVDENLNKLEEGLSVGL